MKLSRMLVVLAAAVLLGTFPAGSAQAAQKQNLSGFSYRAGFVINGFSYSFNFIDLLRLWKGGHRDFFD